MSKIKVQVTIPFSYGEPNRNGVICTKDAIISAIKNTKIRAPIVFDDTVIGITTSSAQIARWDTDTQTCYVTIDGELYSIEANCRINKSSQGVAILQFHLRAISSISLSNA